MKKIAIASLIALVAGAASAADYVSVDVDRVTDRTSNEVSTAQYVRAGKQIAGLQFGLQSRTSTNNTSGGMLNSLETTVGKQFGAVTPFVGVGFDNGFNGAKNADYRYGLVGVTAGAPIGPGFALAGVKTRVGTTAATETAQTVVFGTYSIPVTKQISANLNVSRSYQDIKENSMGLGFGFAF